MSDVRNELQPGESYAEFLEIIKRNFDPASSTVLLIDDERAIRMRVARDVRKFAPDAVIFEAANGQEGLQKLEEIRKRYVNDPLFIVLDLNMPVMDGWAFIRTLKAQYEEQGKPAGIPIIVLSSTSGEKGGFFSRQSVHDGKSGYTPLVTIAKETCVERSHYDAAGEKGLVAWLEYFVRKG